MRESRPKHIVFFSGFFLPFLGGIERYTDKLSRQLVMQGCKVTIVTSNHDALPVKENREGVDIYRLPTLNLFRNRYPIFANHKTKNEVLENIAKDGVDGVICNTRFQLSTLIGLKFAKRNNVTPIIIEHGSSHFTVGVKVLDWFGGIYEHVLTWYEKKYNPKYFGVSGKCNEWLAHFGVQAAGVFYNSVDDDTYEKNKSKIFSKEIKNKIVITYAGRVMKEKGVELLLDAFNGIKDKYEDAVLVIAGDGDYLESIQSKSGEKVILAGRLDYDEVMALFNQTDIFCYPSMYPEGLPTSILEAGIMKSAVIATDRGGTVEVIDNPELGVIIEENSVDAIKEALTSLIGDRTRLEVLKMSLHDRVKKNFTWKITSDKVMKHLRR